MPGSSPLGEAGLLEFMQLGAELVGHGNDIGDVVALKGNIDHQRSRPREEKMAVLKEGIPIFGAMNKILYALIFYEFIENSVHHWCSRYSSAIFDRFAAKLAESILFITLVFEIRPEFPKASQSLRDLIRGLLDELRIMKDALWKMMKELRLVSPVAVNMNLQLFPRPSRPVHLLVPRLAPWLNVRHRGMQTNVADRTVRRVTGEACQPGFLGDQKSGVIDWNVDDAVPGDHLIYRSG